MKTDFLFYFLNLWKKIQLKPSQEYTNVSI